MLSKPDQIVYKAFLALEGDPNFMRILEYLDANRSKLESEGRKEVEIHRLRWKQGAGQVLDDIFETRAVAKQKRLRTTA